MTTIRKPAELGVEDADRERLPRQLESVVVHYEEGPDRRTVYPTGLSDVERMSTWLTADAEDFVELADAR